MYDLGIEGQEITVRQSVDGFTWFVSFYFRATGSWYSQSGSAPTDDMAYASAKSWLVNMVRSVKVISE